MSLNSIEREILEKIAQNQLITKMELIKFLKNEKKVANAKGVLDSAIKSLSSNGFINIINPIGATCLVITQDGSKVLEE
ncbi:MAG: hypothetical protein J7J92_03280 [Candidatus Aenigmarchaeota archaeon]|nr:hypothetical protein [Candidatus Aenigmarchaeota archaeon]